MIIIERLDQTIKKARSQAANMITIGNMMCGAAAILATLNEAYSFSVLFIFIAAFLDRFDGMVARLLNQESELGKQLDSMSDILSFGVAPAILMYELVLGNSGIAGMACTLFYMGAGAFRLARFNTIDSDGYFCGLPITAAGTVLALSFFGLPFFHSDFYIALFLILTLLMISTITLKKI